MVNEEDGRDEREKIAEERAEGDGENRRGIGRRRWRKLQRQRRR